MKVLLLGTGNVAWHLGRRLCERQFPLYGCYGRNPEKVRRLAESCGVAQVYTDLREIPSDVDAYVFALADRAYAELLPRFPWRDKVMLHTSGALPLTLFQGLTAHAAVLYPFQSCTYGVALKSGRLPLCLEASDDRAREVVQTLASVLGDESYWISSAQRKTLHLAGVYANNFSNALFRVAFELLEAQRMDTRLLHPLLMETVMKAVVMPPKDAQTGPAVRGDHQTMQAHLSLLQEDNPLWTEVYRLLSRLIAEP